LSLEFPEHIYLIFQYPRRARIQTRFEMLHQRDGKEIELVSMVHRHASQLFVIGLILLLGAQLTGLSCLDEWPLAISDGSEFDTPQIAGVSPSSGDDGCPCHLAFVSIPSDAHQVSHPVALIDLVVPVTAPLVSPFSLFHPPLSL
jgi:hypothetical protein